MPVQPVQCSGSSAWDVAEMRRRRRRKRGRRCGTGVGGAMGERERWRAGGVSRFVALSGSLADLRMCVRSGHSRARALSLSHAPILKRAREGKAMLTASFSARSGLSPLPKMDSTKSRLQTMEPGTRKRTCPPVSMFKGEMFKG